MSISRILETGDLVYYKSDYWLVLHKIALTQFSCMNLKNNSYGTVYADMFTKVEQTIWQLL